MMVEIAGLTYFKCRAVFWKNRQNMAKNLIFLERRKTAALCVTDVSTLFQDSRFLLEIPTDFWRFIAPHRNFHYSFCTVRINIQEAMVMIQLHCGLTDTASQQCCRLQVSHTVSIQFLKQRGAAIWELILLYRQHIEHIGNTSPRFSAYKWQKKVVEYACLSIQQQACIHCYLEGEGELDLKNV